LRGFLGILLTEETPDHSSLTRVRDRLPLEVHAAVFQWVLRLAAEVRVHSGYDRARQDNVIPGGARWVDGFGGGLG
jgi:hypothetical protein